MKKFLSERLAKDLMTRKVVTVDPGTRVKDIFKLFAEHHIMGVPVVDKEKKVLGIVTERDLAVRGEDIQVPASINILGSVVYLENMEKFHELLHKKFGQIAQDVMTSPALVLPEDAPLGEILAFLEEHDINRVPIVNKNEELVGIITRTDIIKEMIREGKNV